LAVRAPALRRKSRRETEFVFALETSGAFGVDTGEALGAAWIESE
jgi:hypothetical protein